MTQLLRGVWCLPLLTASVASAFDVMLEVSVRVSSQATVDITSEVSSRVTSESSSHGSSSHTPGRRRSSRAAPPGGAGTNEGLDGTACVDHDDCTGFCQQGVCAGGLQCLDDGQCAPGTACQQGMCAAPPDRGCTMDTQCGPGVLCRNGLCVLPEPPPATGGPPPPPSAPPPPSTPPPPPPPALLRRGTERLLRERVAQLQEDLAIGQGPVIAALAAAQGVSPAALGRVLRAHRSELAALVASEDASWPGRFLSRVEALGRTCPGA